LSISPHTLTYPSSGGTRSLVFTTNRLWRLVLPADSEWLTLSRTSGPSGQGQVVTVTASANESYDSRSATLELSAGDATETISVTQHRRTVILLDATPRELSGEAQTFTVEVRSNVDYEVRITDGADWLEELPASRADLERRTHGFRVPRNPAEAPRTAVIRFQDRDSDLFDELAVTQGVYDPFPERSALERLYEASGGDGWIRRDNWCTDAALGEWYGIETDAEGRVTAIRLPDNGLTGTLPEKFTALERLERADLGRNALTGPLPASWSGLPSLRQLDLSYNGFDGPIPSSWGSMFREGRTVDLALNGNRLTGALPAAIRSHAAWNRIALQLMRQYGEGLELGREIVLPEFSFSDLGTGTRYSVRDLHANNELTMLVSWNPHEAASTEFLEKTVRRFRTLFGGQGFAAVAVLPAGEEYRAAAGEYLRSREAWWLTAAECTDGAGERVSLPEAPWPSYLLVDRTGRVTHDMYGGKKGFEQPDALNELVHMDYLNKLFDERFGASEYESGDYSMDGRHEVLQRASRGKGIDIVLMGDAFTDADIETGFYRRMMVYAMEAFFGIEPTKSYRDYFNVHLIYTVSKKAQISNSSGDTALETFINRNGDLILAVYEIDKYMEKVGLKLNPIISTIVVKKCNFGKTRMFRNPDQTYAYSGYIYGELREGCTDNLDAVVMHESVGHGLGYLADEYSYNNYGTISEQKKYVVTQQHNKGMFWNISVSDDPDKVYWSHLIGHPNYPYVGIYEGGYYYTSGVWRSEATSIMVQHRNNYYFNAIGRELIVRRIIELAGEDFTFEKFLAKDSDAGRPGTTSILPMSDYADKESKMKLLPPVIIE